MARVVWVEIHHRIRVGSARNDEPFFITQRWYATERASDIIAFKGTILSA
jgi:hypothetical protein